jgi:hypothetical protein
MNNLSQVSDSIFNNIRSILEDARSRAYRSINFIMVEAYWNIGRIIVDEEQKGKRRAEFGKQLIADLSRKLTVAYGRGFDPSNLWYMRKFYLLFPILDAVRRELSDSLANGDSKSVIRLGNSIRPELTWTHYRLLLRIENPQARSFYMNESAYNGWSTRELDRW